MDKSDSYHLPVTGKNVLRFSICYLPNGRGMSSLPLPMPPHHVLQDLKF